MDKTVQIVDSVVTESIQSLEKDQRLVLLADELGTAPELAHDTWHRRQTALQREAEEKKAAASLKTAQFWHDLIPGRRTEKPIYPIYTTRYDTIQRRKKAHRRPFYKKLDAKNVKRAQTWETKRKQTQDMSLLPIESKADIRNFWNAIRF